MGRPRPRETEIQGPSDGQRESETEMERWERRGKTAPKVGEGGRGHVTVAE